MTWYYIDETITDGERRKGPYSIDEIKDFVKSGDIKNETLVWHSGMENWIRWEETEESKDKPAEQSIDALSEEEQVKAALEAILAEHRSQKRYAGFFIRGAAYFTDNILLSVIGIAVYMILGAAQFIDTTAIGEAMNELLVSYQSGTADAEAVNKFFSIPGMDVIFSIQCVLQAVYFTVFTALWSTTPGKRIFNLYVEANGRENVGWITSTLRYVASLFTQLTLLFYGIGYLVVMIDPKRRALHDWIAKTQVIHQQKPATVSKKK